MKRTQKDTEESARLVSRRGLMLGAMQVGVVGVLALRMRFMQIDQSEQFKLLSDENSIKIRLLPPARGLILDRNGHLVAGN